MDKSINERNIAPKKAPIAPGIASCINIFLSMLFACQWEAPEARVVKISAIWTAVDARAADAPSVNSMVELSNPNPIPSAPSTS